MLILENTIRQYNLFKNYKNIGVAVSGGMDSMSLLYFLSQKAKDYKINIIAIHLDHLIRENSNKDASLIRRFCKSNGITFKMKKVNVVNLSLQHKISLEEAGRMARQNFFNELLDDKIVDAVCTGHHKSDQAETVLLNIFRGSGLNGAKGMTVLNGKFIKPMLFTSKEHIVNYVKKNNIPYNDDYTNSENEYTRNFVRNEIFPLINERFPFAINNLASFSKIAKADDDFIHTLIPEDGIIKDDYMVRIPASYFQYEEPIVNRMLLKSFEHLNANKDIEEKHLRIIKSMVSVAQSGTKINLPNNVMVQKEYDHITVVSKNKKYSFKSVGLKSGVTSFGRLGEVSIKRTYKPSIKNLNNQHIVDGTKIPTNAIWRTKLKGDVFTKFGGGTKKLVDYLSDKKVPQRLRGMIPVLASESEIYIVAGMEISEKAKIDETSKSGFILDYNMKIR